MDLDQNSPKTIAAKRKADEEAEADRDYKKLMAVVRVGQAKGEGKGQDSASSGGASN